MDWLVEECLEAVQERGAAALDDVLKELGVASMGHRTKIANALAA